MLYHFYDSCKDGVLPHLLRTEHEAARLVDGPRVERRSQALGDRQGLSAEHTFIDKRFAFHYSSVDRNAFARLHQEQVVRHDSIHACPAVVTIGEHERDLSGLQSHEFSDRVGRLAFGSFFQKLSKQDEGDHNGRRFEVDVCVQSSLMPDLGEQRIEDAEKVSHTCTQGDERVHVGGTMPELLPCIDEEPAAEPYNHRRTQRPHDPIRSRHIHQEHTDDRRGDGEQRGEDRLSFDLGVMPPPDLLKL